MAHKVQSMFSYKETPWHNLGTVVDVAPTSADAIKLAGLDWEVKTQPMYLKDGKQVPDAQAVVRVGEHPTVLGVVGSRYTPVQNKAAFDFIDSVVSNRHATFETAGSLEHGRKIWMLCRMTDSMEIGPEDEVRKYLLLSNSHDGTMAVTVALTPIRVVCWNTLNLALQDSVSKQHVIRIHHTRSVHQNMKVIANMLATANAKFNETEQLFKRLAGKQINRFTLDELSQSIFPQKDKDGKGIDLNGLRINRVSKLFDGAGKGSDLSSARGTLWGWYNAVAELVDYDTTRRNQQADVRLKSVWFGTGQATKQKALTAALQQL